VSRDGARVVRRREIAASSTSIRRIKVDREDGLTSTTSNGRVQTLTGGRRLAHDSRADSAETAVFGGTYFPARDGERGSNKGFLTILP